MEKIDIQKLISTVEEVPTLSQVYHRISALISSETASATEIATAIEADAGIALRVLRAANSAFIRRATEVKTIPQAVVTLGLQPLRALVLSASVLRAMRKYAVPELVALWKYSYASGCASRFLAERLHEEPEEAFVMGLTQNLGQLILQSMFPEEYVEIHSLCQDPATDLVSAEEQVFGTSHVEIGYLIGRRWNLPEKFVQCSRYHHNPEAAAEYRVAACIAHLSEAIVKGLGLGSTGDDHVRPLRLKAETWAGLALQSHELDRIVGRTLKAFEEFEDFYALTSQTGRLTPVHAPEPLRQTGPKPRTPLKD